jgi:hypothetical protein
MLLVCSFFSSPRMKFFLDLNNLLPENQWSSTGPYGPEILQEV